MRKPKRSAIKTTKSKKDSTSSIMEKAKELAKGRETTSTKPPFGHPSRI